MAWIQLHQSLWTHRKTLALAEALDIAPIVAAAHMARLWCWALDNAPDGDLARIGLRTIAIAAGFDGRPPQFLDAMSEAGFVDNCALHDWDEYAGRLIAGRRRHAETMRRRRQIPARDPHVTGPLPACDDHVTITQPSRDDHVTRTLPARDALEKSREEKNRKEASGGGARTYAWVNEILPGATAAAGDHDAIAGLIALHPAVDHEYEMRKLRLKRREPSRRGWASDYISWVLDGQSVKFLDGTTGKATRTPEPEPEIPADLEPTDLPIWDRVRDRLIDSMGRSNYDRWFGDAAVTLEERTLSVSVATEFERQWIAQRLHDHIPQALRDCDEPDITVAYTVQPERRQA